jgi:hypothetical protein
MSDARDKLKAARQVCSTAPILTKSSSVGAGLRRLARRDCLRCELPHSRSPIYTRVSTEYGLEQEFNSLDNQREASEAYIKSQAHEGWKLIRDRYDDGGFSGGSMRGRR